MSIEASDLKTRGIAAIAGASTDAKVMVSVGGVPSFVVMHVERYYDLRESELDAALAESPADLAAGRRVDAHLKRLGGS